MADHHEFSDGVDRALDLLRSRQWAGPATNPLLEQKFMGTHDDGRRVNLRLVLGLAGALIGCGAVAAATRPSWVPAIWRSEAKVVIAPAARAIEAASVATRSQRPVVPAVARAEPARVDRSAAVATAMPARPSARQAALVAAAPVPAAEPDAEPVEIQVAMDPQAEIERAEVQLEAALFDRMLQGDEEAGEQLVCSWYSEPKALVAPPPFLGDVLKSLIFTVRPGSQIEGRQTLEWNASGQIAATFTIVGDGVQADGGDQTIGLAIDATGEPDEDGTVEIQLVPAPQQP